MTYFSERPSDRIPYITLFPVGNTMRANLFVYREVDDPWLREFRRAPVETLNASLPRLRRIMGEFAVTGDIKIRPVDLYTNSGYRQAGIVLVGDAFRTTCPAPAPTKFLRTSSGSATSIFRRGFRPKACPRTR
jgi:2-polyprenyl-6-methoxyphenol hydroxylase-like FAD-dependent oxidoreductase